MTLSLLKPFFTTLPILSYRERGMVKKCGKYGNLPLYEAKNSSSLPLFTALVKSHGKENGKEHGTVYLFTPICTSSVVSTPLAEVGAEVTSRSGSGVQFFYSIKKGGQ